MKSGQAAFVLGIPEYNYFLITMVKIMIQGMRRVNLETRVSSNFKYMARDLNGSVYIFEDVPNIATDIACDTWDVKTGEIKKILDSTPASSAHLDLGDWRESLVELGDEVYS